MPEGRRFLCRALCLAADGSRHECKHRHETSEILSIGRRPCALRHRREAREGHVVGEPPVVEVFAPETCLHAEQSRVHFAWPVAARIVGVAVLQRNVSCPACAGLPPIR